MANYILKSDLQALIDGPSRRGLHYITQLKDYVAVEDILKLKSFSERQIIENAFVEKGQSLKNFKLGEKWALTGADIREVLDELFGPKELDQ